MRSEIIFGATILFLFIIGCIMKIGMRSRPVRNFANIVLKYWVVVREIIVYR